MLPTKIKGRRNIFNSLSKTYEQKKNFWRACYNFRSCYGLWQSWLSRPVSRHGADFHVTHCCGWRVDDFLGQGKSVARQR